MSEADALVLDRSIRFSEKETALEQGWLLQELERRFSYSLDDLARRFDRSVSWGGLAPVGSGGTASRKVLRSKSPALF